MLVSPGLNTSIDREDTLFNTCKRGASYIDFFNYRTMVHEAGHALGLSNFSYYEALSSAVAHSHIPDSVMNNDRRVSLIVDEPDCSPHPFDVMALEALYQTVRP